MPLYEMTEDRLSLVEARTFTKLGYMERQNLQRAIRTSIDAITPNVSTMVLAEEFGEWVGVNRRIDLLCLDEEANLVVVELKRESATHMELQAIRYAAMISTMRFEQAVQAHAKYLKSIGSSEDAEQSIREFLGKEDGQVAFTEKVRIVLAASEFNSEITTSVLWLNEQGLDIRCVQLRPHEVQGKVLVDIQQIIPLPGAADYQVALREKVQEQTVAARADNRDLTRYDLTIGQKTFSSLPKRRLIYEIVAELIRRGATPDQLMEVSGEGQRMFARAEGKLNKEAMLTIIPESRADRFYLDDEDLFHVGGYTYAMTRMWGSQTLDAIQAILQLDPRGGDIDYEPHRYKYDSTPREYKQWVISRDEGGSIHLVRDGQRVAPVMPGLRQLAAELNVPLDADDNGLNTRRLGELLMRTIDELES